MKKKLFIWMVLPFVVGVTVVSLTQADTHDEVRQLSEDQQILPLEELLKQVRQQHPGRVLEVELEKESGQYIYEIEVLNKQGQVSELKYNAQTGELLKYETDD